MRKTVKIGEMKHQIEIQNEQLVYDDDGFETKQWVTKHKVRCKVSTEDVTKGRAELIVDKGGGQMARTVNLFFMRYIPGITPSDRVLFKGNIYNITMVDNIDEADKFIELECDRIW